MMGKTAKTKETTAVNLEDVKVADVGATCILLVSKFSRVLKAKHGKIVRLQDKQVLSTVASYANASDSAELKLIYGLIEREVSDYLSAKGVVFGDSASSAIASTDSWATQPSAVIR